MRDKLTDENRRRLQILVGFGIMEGRSVSGNKLLNDAVEHLFLEIYDRYRQSADPKDCILEMMRQILPEQSDAENRI